MPQRVHSQLRSSIFTEAATMENRKNRKPDPLRPEIPLGSLSASTLRQIWVVGFLLGSVWLLSSCSRLPPECEAFLALSPTDRQIESRKHPTEKQIDMYLCAMKQEPPDLQLAYEIADRGETAIPVLIGRLKTTKNEMDQEDLIRIFEVMSGMGHLRGRVDVVSAISDVVDDMKQGPIREDSEESLTKIRINSGVKPFTYVR